MKKAKSKPNAKIKTFLKGLLVGILCFSLINSLVKDDPSKTKLRHKLQPEVVKIVDPMENGSGTGFYLEATSGKYYVLTNDHVCSLAGTGNQLVLIHNDGSRSVTKIIKRDTKSDLCLLDAPQEHGLELGNDVSKDEILYIYGYPLGIAQVLASGFALIDLTVTFESDLPKDKCFGGNLRWVTKEIRFFGQVVGRIEVCEKSIASILTSTVIYPGNSGSPVLNESGDVIGIAFAAITATGFGFIIPVWEIKRFIQEVEDGQKEIQKTK